MRKLVNLENSNINRKQWLPIAEVDLKESVTHEELIIVITMFSIVRCYDKRQKMKNEILSYTREFRVNKETNRTWTDKTCTHDMYEKFSTVLENNGQCFVYEIMDDILDSSIVTCDRKKDLNGYTKLFLRVISTDNFNEFHISKLSTLEGKECDFDSCDEQDVIDIMLKIFSDIDYNKHMINGYSKKMKAETKLESNMKGMNLF